MDGGLRCLGSVLLSSRPCSRRGSSGLPWARRRCRSTGQHLPGGKIRARPGVGTSSDQHIGSFDQNGLRPCRRLSGLDYTLPVNTRSKRITAPVDVRSIAEITSRLDRTGYLPAEERSEFRSNQHSIRFQPGKRVGQQVRQEPTATRPPSSGGIGSMLNTASTTLMMSAF